MNATLRNADILKI